jgi:hypothetical protein
VRAGHYTERGAVGPTWNKHARLSPGVVAGFVSRVLLPARVTSSGPAVIPLGHALPRASSSLPRSSGGQPSNAPLRGLAPDGVCLATTVTDRAVGSYSTVSPLPDPIARGGRSAFLWHFPRGHPHRALPGILPCGARTFLPARHRAERSPEPLRRAEPSTARLPKSRARGGKGDVYAAESRVSQLPERLDRSWIFVLSLRLARTSSWRARSLETPSWRPISARLSSSSRSAMRRFSTM